MAHMTPRQGGRTHTPAPSALPAVFLLLRAPVLPVFPLENQGPRGAVCVHGCIPSAAHSDVCVMDEGPGISRACSGPCTSTQRGPRHGSRVCRAQSGREEGLDSTVWPVRGQREVQVQGLRSLRCRDRAPGNPLQWACWIWGFKDG